MVDLVGLADGACAFARFQPTKRLGLLIGSELGFATELGASGLSGGEAIPGALDDALPLVLGHGTDKGDEAPAQGGREVQVRLV